MLQEVRVTPLPIDRFFPLIGKRRASQLQTAIQHAQTILAGRRVWNINSTATGGGVAEMLQTLLGYERGCGIDARWLVIHGDEPFFAITKRLHNQLHGNLGDGGALVDAERAHYAKIQQQNAVKVLKQVRPHDIVIAHDPQTAGLVPALRQAGAVVIWRCHIGTDTHNEIMQQAWGFLRSYVAPAHAFIFSRRAFAPTWLDQERLRIVPPAIDAFSVKNQAMSGAVARTILTRIGVLQPNGGRAKPQFTRLDGSTALVERQAKVTHNGKLPTATTPLVVQVSRWDRLKDMIGVMRGFVRHLDRTHNVHLMLVGPDVWGVTDDPEGIAVLSECIAAWHKLPSMARDRVSLVCLPMEDVEENAAMVNALQRHATIVVQKSLQEGFGLTVTEAMWKERPVVASAVGGIQEQIVHDEHGLLLENPSDLRRFGQALQRLLVSQAFARRLGKSARRRTLSLFLASSHMLRHIDLFGNLVQEFGIANGHQGKSEKTVTQPSAAVALAS
ncbi:MAG: glycosyltransferase [Candidatus Binatia bacterium]